MRIGCFGFRASRFGHASTKARAAKADSALKTTVNCQNEPELIGARHGARGLTRDGKARFRLND